MEDEIIVPKMNELAESIGYAPTNIYFLKQAMYRQKLQNSTNYTNDSLATLGDSLLSFFLAEYFFDKGLDKAEITKRKQAIEKNKTLYNLRNESNIIKYAYNDLHFYHDAPLNYQVSSSKHDSYIEAIVAAIYKDKGIEYCKNWVFSFFKQHNVSFN